MSHSRCLVSIFALISTFIGYSHGQEATLKIFPGDPEINVPLGTSKLLTCQVLNLNDQQINPYMKWYKLVSGVYEELRATSGRTYIESTDLRQLKLYFTAVSLEDESSYKCTAELQGAIQEVLTQVKLYKAIDIYAPSPQVFEVDTEAVIICEVSGQPAPTVSWRYNGRTINTDENHIVEQGGLRILNIRKEDERFLYICRAEVVSSGDHKIKEISVDVQTPPVIDQPMGEQRGTEGHEFSLECFASSDPDPKYEFFRVGRDGSQVEVTSRDDIFVDRDKGVINFTPVSRGNAGTYRCRAFNDVAFVDDEGSLVVYVEPKIDTYNNETAEEKTTATVTCIAIGNPAPTMTFQKIRHNVVYQEYSEGQNDGGRVTLTTRVLSPNDPFEVKKSQLTMTITNVGPEDTANYTCISQNAAGERKLNGTLRVKHQPRFDANHPTEFYVWAGKTRNITCNTLAYPEPTFKWFKDGRELQNNETYAIKIVGQDSNLQITAKIEDQGWIFGYYTCRAINDYGNAEVVIDVMRATVPGPPQNVSILQLGPTMIMFKPQPPTYNGGIGVTEFRLEFDQSMRRLTLDEEARVENLSPQKTYNFRVRAVNEVGFGEPYRLDFTTPPIRAPSPLNLEPPPETPEYPYSYELRWRKPESGGMPIERYEFRIRKVEVDDVGRVSRPLEDWVRSLRDENPKFPIQSVQFKNLDPSSYYEVQARAGNGIGWALNWNTEYVFETAEDPSYGHIRDDASDLVGSVSLVLGAFVWSLSQLL